MPEFNATLLREKFVIQDLMPKDLSDSEPVIALSNRMVLTLKPTMATESEVLVIRAQNMHCCARMAAKIAHSFQEEGPITTRPKPFDFKEAYAALTKGYEDKYNPRHWVAVYHKGRAIFEGGPGTRHPFLDIIEQCDARNRQNYDKSLEIAEDAFKQAGKLVNIHHDSNIALIINIAKDEARCGIILRSPSRTTTFNFTAEPDETTPLAKPSQCLSVSAAFLEGIQLTFLIGMIKQKLYYELISVASDEAKQHEEAIKKLGQLNAAIDQFEHLQNVRYRPERPKFPLLINEAEEFARKALSSEIEDRIAGGDSDWVI
ncbi:MAG: hypothetical protein H6868_04910 [Rhodospirillales bacterium]|nr:hypothetical protein [Rhodospirillales bacterium]